MGGKARFSLVFWVLALLGGSAGAVEQYVEGANITATASSVNYQLEAIYSCNGNGLTGEVHTNNIGGEPPAAGAGTMWLGSVDDANPWIEYQFDKGYIIQEMWVWNYNQITPDGGDRTGRGMQECTIEYTSDGTNWTQLGSVHTFARADGTGAYAHNTVVSFGDVDVMGVRITAVSNYGGRCTGLSEVRFVVALAEYARYPIPADGEVNVDEDIVLGWMGGELAESHDVYLGTEPESVENAGKGSAEYKGSRAAHVTSFSPGGLGWGSTYYWRIDEINESSPDSPWKGNVWRFTVGGPASSPRPRNGAEDVSPNAVLSWTAGSGASMHDVYFGTLRSHVETGNASLVVGESVYKGRQDANSYAAALDFEKTYYWRVDEVKGETIIKGAVWRFGTGRYWVMDDFESYGTEDISETWAQLGGMWTSSRRDPNHGGALSMELAYYNQGELVFSEAERTFGGGEDWTAGRAKALGLFFAGDPTNILDRVYIMVEDSAGRRASVSYDGEEKDLQSEEWHSWDIALREFSEGGVDLTAVSKLAIGVGNRNASAGKSMGYLYVDDIRLYPPRCVARFARQSDFDGDCVVDFDDVRVMGVDWLDTDYTVTASEPDAGRLLAHYKFDESSGTVAADSSGGGNDVTVDPNGEDGWSADGYDGSGCLNFDGTFRVTVPTELFRRVNLAITVSLWVNGAVDMQPDPEWGVIFNGGNSTNDRILLVHCPTADGEVMFESGGLRIQRLVWAGAEPNDWEGQWNHYAFTLDGSKKLIRIYRNGHIVGERSLRNPPRPITEFAIGGGIGTGLTRAYYGRIDDFRIYNYAFSQAEAAYLAGTDSLFVDLDSPAELFVDNIVNYKDFAVLAEEWLVEELWPE